ncbi:MAG: fucose isomerase [Planctomycetaceae bacterium]|jgi:hypothetical protein|nr:fucose isomerase [Planctomycetaceae bacterium]
MAVVKTKTTVKTKSPVKNTAILFACGDFRLQNNQNCWLQQEVLESALTQTAKNFGYNLVRANVYNPLSQHGFITSRKECLETFATISPQSPLIVTNTNEFSSHNIVPFLLTHEGPILTVGHWSGSWQSVDGMLQLNGSLCKAGKQYSTLWSGDFTDRWFLERFEKWLKTGIVRFANPHVKPGKSLTVQTKDRQLGEKLANEIRVKKSLIGSFDVSSNRMYNTIVPPELLLPLGIYKEAFSQASLYAAAMMVPDDEARDVYRWVLAKGTLFNVGGDDQDSDLTLQQILLQCKTYIAAVRIADEYSCDAIGVPMLPAFKDLLPDSGFIEGLLNNSDRPPVRAQNGRVLFDNKPVIHFHRGDELAGVDALLHSRVAQSLGQSPETTQQELRWGDVDQTNNGKDFILTFQTDSGVPPQLLDLGWKGMNIVRQLPQFSKQGGGIMHGMCKSGEIVWSRMFMERGRLCMDIGRGRALKLQHEEVRRRRMLCTQDWTIMNAILTGVTKDNLVARNRSNYINVAYADTPKNADHLMAVKAAMVTALGVEVYLCGV